MNGMFVVSFGNYSLLIGLNSFKKTPKIFINKISQITTMSSAEIDPIEVCKARAATLAVDDHINSDCILGIGSGSTMKYVLERLSQRCKENNYAIKCIPTSLQSKQLIYDYNLPITDIDRDPVIDVTIDGADEVDENFVAIKGGGACLAQEKVIAFVAKKFIVVADYRKKSQFLGQNWTKGIPIEVLPMAFNAVRNHICNRFSVNVGEVKLRDGKEKAGPVITDNGNLILDWRNHFVKTKNYTSEDWRTLSNEIKLIPGVVEVGIFAGMVKEVYFGKIDGTVERKVSQ